MTAPTPTHACPGGCGTEVSYQFLACKPCWFRLPKPLQGAVTAAWKRRERAPGAHRAAIQAAVAWYRSHPPEPGGGDG